MVTALVGLVAAIESNSLWGLTFFTWSGEVCGQASTFRRVFLGPYRRHSIPARIEFSTRFMPKMLLLMPTLVTMTLASGFQLAATSATSRRAPRTTTGSSPSYIVVGIMAIVAIGILEPANLTVLFELKKPQPNGLLIANQMRRFVYTAGITGAMQVGRSSS